MRLTVDGVGKRYGDVWGLRDFSLAVEDGVVGLLGPNGAGKSTLMRILATVTKPTEGTVSWCGTDVRESPDAIRSALGYLPQSFGVYPNVTAREFLQYMGSLKGMDRGSTRTRVEELLAATNLEAAADRRLSTYSGGMKQRVGIAVALLNDPDLVIVDEPTVGLDPEERVRFHNLVSDLAGDRIVLLSTHIVADIESVATSVAVLQDGRLLQHDAPSALVERVAGDVYRWTVPDDRLRELKRSALVTGTTRRKDGVQVRVVAEDPPGEDATPVEATLEDAYLALVEGY